MNQCVELWVDDADSRVVRLLRDLLNNADPDPRPVSTLTRVLLLVACLGGSVFGCRRTENPAALAPRGTAAERTSPMQAWSFLSCLNRTPSGLRLLLQYRTTQSLNSETHLRREAEQIMTAVAESAGMFSPIQVAIAPTTEANVSRFLLFQLNANGSWSPSGWESARRSAEPTPRSGAVPADVLALISRAVSQIPNPKLFDNVDLIGTCSATLGATIDRVSVSYNAPDASRAAETLDATARVLEQEAERAGVETGEIVVTRRDGSSQGYALRRHGSGWVVEPRSER